MSAPTRCEEIRQAKPAKAEKPNTHCVVYRTGGTENFQWHRSLAMSYSEALDARDAEHRAGRAAHVEDYQRSLSIGLPETFA